MSTNLQRKIGSTHESPGGPFSDLSATTPTAAIIDGLNRVNSVSVRRSNNKQIQQKLREDTNKTVNESNIRQ